MSFLRLQVIYAHRGLLVITLKDEEQGGEEENSLKEERRREEDRRGLVTVFPDLLRIYFIAEGSKKEPPSLSRLSNERTGR